LGLKKNKYLIECIGTYFLVLAYGLSGDAIAIGFTLSALVFIGAAVSGAHYNPAISIGAFLLKKLTLSELTGYIISQIVGAFLAASTVLFISSFVFYVEPPINSGFYQQLGIEIILTFLLTLSALVAWIGNKSHKNVATYSFVVGFTLVALVLIGQNISGGIFNPAISIGTSILDYLLGGASYRDVITYTMGPIFGALIAAYTYKFVIEERY
jgi:glycerol uptake facilitator-like aquaporin